MSHGRAPNAVLLVIVAAATAYEALIALELIGLGTEPGAGAPWEAAVLPTALIAMLIAVVLVLADPTTRLAAFVPLGAAAFMLARFYSFDPYYLPTLRRMSDGGLVSPALVYLVLVLSFGAAALIRMRPRAGSLLAAPAVLACAFLTVVMPGGH
jgi:hypothetical protein